MLKLLRYCIQRGLGSQLVILLAVSSFAGASSIWFADQFAKWLQGSSAINSNADWKEVALLISVFVASTLFGLAAEYQSQTLSARIAACLGGDYLRRFRFGEISAGAIEAAKSDMTATLLNQMERYRQDYLMMATSALTRLIILSILGIYLVTSYPSQTITALIAGGLFLALTHFALRSFARLTDRHITQGNNELGDVVTRASRTILAISLTGIKSEAIRRYIQSYHHLGVGRGLNGIMSLLPKSIIETLVIASVFAFALLAGGITIKSDMLVYVATLALKFNPHLQILIKNLSIMQTTKRAEYLLDLEEPVAAVCATANDQMSEPSVLVGELPWFYARQKWLRVTGPSGSGKTTALLKAADQLSKRGVAISMIQNNDDIPLFTFADKSFTHADLLADVSEMGLAHIGERLGRDLPHGWHVEGLSNGERQRVLIALTVRSGTRVLMLDEGLSALDDDTIALVLRYLAKQPISILFCCHGRSDRIHHELGDALIEHGITPLKAEALQEQETQGVFHAEKIAQIRRC